eukprot:CFRG5660T1
MRKCAVCDKKSTCQCRCKTRFFCSRECQIVDWRQFDHKYKCPRKVGFYKQANINFGDSHNQVFNMEHPVAINDGFTISSATQTNDQDEYGTAVDMYKLPDICHDDSVPDIQIPLDDDSDDDELPAANWNEPEKAPQNIMSEQGTGVYEQNVAKPEEKSHCTKKRLGNDGSTDSRLRKKTVVRKAALEKKKAIVPQLHGAGVHACGWGNCGWRFHNKSGLRRHQRIHTKEKPYHCPHADCDKSFSQRHHVKAHYQSVHDDVKAFACSLDNCKKSFARKESLTRHGRTHK